VEKDGRMLYEIAARTTVADREREMQAAVKWRRLLAAAL
jgi:hypothetical protein